MKNRITVMLGINSENEKLFVLIVGKSRNPRCFKQINVKTDLGFIIIQTIPHG